jgi:hypothetical protein
MKGESIGGEYKGTQLQELPVAQKLRWADWRLLHPDTLVLSVNGLEDVPVNPYEPYLHSEDGFRGMEAEDHRLETKQEIFAFRLDGRAFAAAFPTLVGGKTFQIDAFTLFLFRGSESPIYESTVAYKIVRGTVERIDQNWTHRPSGAVFDNSSRTWTQKVQGIEPLAGFDTFWYTWSPFHPDSEILR